MGTPWSVALTVLSVRVGIHLPQSIVTVVIGKRIIADKQDYSPTVGKTRRKVERDGYSLRIAPSSVGSANVN